MVGTPRMIDLHSHTTASDGQHSPTDLLQRAAQAGVKRLAVTDHDTVAGLEEAQSAAHSHGVQLINGIEVSAFIHGKEIHVLGHFLDITEPRLLAYTARLRNERTDRMERMVAQMCKLGYPVTMAEVRAIAQDAQLGRPHLARVLVEKRYTTSVKEAFDRWLGDGKPGWVDRIRITGEDAIQLIKGAGGAATLAHPAVSRATDLDIQNLSDAGLAGLEVFHSDHVPSQREKLLKLTQRLGLVPTAGSDYHGPDVTPDRNLGDETMDERLFDELRNKIARRA